MTISIKYVPRLAYSWITTNILKRKNPLFVEWNITFRCPYKCIYCGAEDVETSELSTPEIKKILNILYHLGVRWITFGGGEPLVKKDILEILDTAKRLGFIVFLSTTGINIDRFPRIENVVDHVNLSFDGPQEIHDRIRGKDSYKHLFEVVEFCKSRSISTSFLCVISLINIFSIDYVLEKSKQIGIPVMFQPATLHLDSSMKRNPIAPPPDEYRKAIENIIKAKKGGYLVRNSVAGLRYLQNWPHPTSIWCPAGRLCFTIEPDGSVLSCHMWERYKLFEHTKDNNSSFDNRIKTLQVPQGCQSCWCAPIVELALIWKLNMSALWNAVHL